MSLKNIFRKIRDSYDKKFFDVKILEDATFLNIGAGITKIDCAVNIDISQKADISLNLGVDQLPFENESIDLIYSDHTIEHVKNYLYLIEEIHRVLKKGGCFIVGVPYVTLTKYHLVNPYHLNNFNEFSFDFFDPTKLRGSAAEDAKIDLRRLNYYCSYIGIFRFLPFVRSQLRQYLFNVVRDIKFVIVKGGDPSDITLNIAKNLPSYYRGISSLRKIY